jgi:DNA-binding NtrC family response regulator
VGRRILIVDQDPNYREILRTLLEKRGYIVTTLEQGYQVANVVKRKTFDIIFLDSQTGGTRDSGLFAKVRKECPGCNIILMTSKRGDEFIREAMGAGAYGCINKPFDPEEVLTMVHHIIPGKKQSNVGPDEKKNN